MSYHKRAAIDIFRGGRPEATRSPAASASIAYAHLVCTPFEGQWQKQRNTNTHTECRSTYHLNDSPDTPARDPNAWMTPPTRWKAKTQRRPLPVYGLSCSPSLLSSNPLTSYGNNYPSPCSSKLCPKCECSDKAVKTSPLVERSPFVCVCFFLQTENVREDILKLGEGVGAVEVDLMEPFSADKSPK